MNFLNLIAYPISMLFGLVVFVRNKLFDLGLIKSEEFQVPVISIGNLSMGGTGKTPHIEYLVRLLKSKNSLAILSRGYGRKSTEFTLLSETSNSSEVGDEPRQFKRKFNDIAVAVESKRVKGIKKLLELFPKLNIILLDDALQHRYVKPGLSILLTDYNKLYYKDHLFPTGTLREGKSGAQRADIIIVTKTPVVFSALDKKRIQKEIKPQAYQRIYFSFIQYGHFIPFQASTPELDKETCFKENYSVLLITGIANASPLEGYLKDKVSLSSVNFSDHHEYSIVELMNCVQQFNKIDNTKKIILTTEKDAMRMDKSGLIEIIKDLPVYYLPIEIVFQDKDSEEFNQQIFDYVRANKSYH